MEPNIFKTEKKTLPFYKGHIDPDMTSDLEVSFIGLVDRPAIEKNFQAFKDHKVRTQFKINSEKQIISGPAMISDMPLYRNDKDLGEYYVVFDKPSIQTIVEKFSAKGFMQKFNLFHDHEQKVNDITIFNSFIADKLLGVKPPVGFEDLPDGSWFISAKVNNPAVWDKVRTGEIKGFSVEGVFTYKPSSVAAMSEAFAYWKIKSILENNVNGREDQTLEELFQTFKQLEPRLSRTDFDEIIESLPKN
jgi:hypothetical protein